MRALNFHFRLGFTYYGEPRLTHFESWIPLYSSLQTIRTAAELVEGTAFTLANYSFKRPVTCYIRYQYYMEHGQRPSKLCIFQLVPTE